MRYNLTPPRIKISENDVEKACVDLAGYRGWWAVRLHAGRYKTLDGKRFVTGVDKGTPDYALVHRYLPGFLLETKRPGEDLSAVQIRKCREIELGVGLTIAVVDDARGLETFLKVHEERSAAEWRKLLMCA